MRPLLWIEQNRCQTCDRCAARASCRTRAIVQYEQGDLPVIQGDRCRGCQACVPACPYGAIQSTPLPIRSAGDGQS